MSVLIELSEATERLTLEELPPENFINTLQQVLSNPEFELKHFSQVEDQSGMKKNEILTIIGTECYNQGKSSRNFIRDMEWRFFMCKERLEIKVKFFNQKRENFLKAETQRMKIELMILLRTINAQLLSEENLLLNPSNGLLEYHFRITWKEYKVKIPKSESLRRFLHYLISKINNFEEVIYFCEPQMLTNKDEKRLHLFDDYIKLTNNFRTIMKNTINKRGMNFQFIGRLKHLKEIKPNNEIELQHLNHEKLQISLLFQRNVCEMYQESIGLEKCHENDEIYNKCVQNIIFHENFKDKNNIEPGQKQNASDSENKIVHGIDIIKKDKEKVISKEGAHSQITRGVFIFRLVKSIDCEVVKEEPKKWLFGTEKKSELTVKRCLSQNETSRNSFMNELQFLNHVRDFHSSFIGKYYLEMKTLRERNEKEPIYMKSYHQNVDYIIRKCKTLSIKEKLSLLYRISLGLCFLSSKNIIHRDFKPHNIVVNSALTPHIIDFGSCCSIYGSNSFTSYDKRLLTTKYIHIYYHELPTKYHYIYQKMSKEEYEQHPLFDVYSLGKMISFVMFGCFDHPQYDRVEQEQYSEILKNIIFLIEMCINVDPDDRPTIGEVTGFLGSLSKFYTAYQEYFQLKVNQYSEKRSISEPKPESNKKIMP